MQVFIYMPTFSVVYYSLMKHKFTNKSDVKGVRISTYRSIKYFESGEHEKIMYCIQSLYFLHNEAATLAPGCPFWHLSAANCSGM